MKHNSRLSRGSDVLENPLVLFISAMFFIPHKKKLLVSGKLESSLVETVLVDCLFEIQPRWFNAW